MTEILPEVPSNDPTCFCRLCFSQQNIHWVIRTFGTTVDLPFVNTIGECLGLWLSLKEDFPCAVCRRCTRRLEEIARFRESCRLCDEAVRNKRRKDPSAMVLFYDYPEDKVFINDGSTKPGFLLDDPDYESLPIVPEVVLDERSVELDKRIQMSRSQKESALKSYMDSYVVWSSHINRSKDDDEMTVDAPESLAQENLPELSVLCEKYEYNFKQKSQKKQLVTIAHPCCFCSKTFYSKQNLNHHKKTVHRDMKNQKKERWKCPDCSQLFMSLSQMRMHAIRHKRSLLINCPTCGIQFLTQNELTAHLKNNGCRLKSFGKCKYCDRTFSRRGRYIFHLKKLHPDKPIPSNKTSESARVPPAKVIPSQRLYTESKKTAINYKTIEDRARLVVMLEPLTDVQCKTFGVERSSNASNSSHEEKQCLVCTLCYERFNNMETYKNHLVGCFRSDNPMDKAPPPYELCKCDPCEALFQSVEPLVEHLREHEQSLHIKPHDCMQCNTKKIPKFLIHPHSPTMILGD